MRVYTSILVNDTSSTRGRSYRACQMVFAAEKSGIDNTLGASQSILQADIPEDRLEEFITALDAALVEIEASAITLSTEQAVYILGDPNVGVGKFPFVGAPAVTDFDPLAIGM